MAFESGPQSSRIQEINQMMAQRKQELEAAKKQVTGFIPRIMQTTSQLFRQTPQGQVAVRSAESQRIQAKAIAEQQIQQAESSLETYQKEFESYLKSPSGIIQYAKETGIAPKVTYRNVVVSDAGGSYNASLPVYIYETPYGTYEDTGEVGSYLAKKEYSSIQTPEQATQFAAKYGITGGWESILKPIEETPEIQQRRAGTGGIVSVTPQGTSYTPFVQQGEGTSAVRASSGREIPALQQKPAKEKYYSPYVYVGDITDFSSSQKDYSLFGKSGPSLSGALEYAGKKAGEFVGEQPVSFSDIAPYRVRGTAVNFRVGEPITPKTLLTPEEYSRIKETKTGAAKEGAKMTVETAPFLIPGALGIAAGPTSALLTWHGAEQYFTPRGREKIGQTAEVLGKPIAWALPAVEMGLGAYGIRQAFLSRQLASLKAATPEIKVGILFPKKDELFLRQVSEQRIPFPGIQYKPVPFGAETISPRLITPMEVKLIPTTKGFNFEGVARTYASPVDIFTGYPSRIVTTPYPIFGKLSQANSARLVSSSLKISPIEQPFLGKSTAVGKKLTSEVFAGFPVKEYRSGAVKILSGPVTKVRYYIGEDISRAVMTPKSIGLVIPKEPQISFQFGNLGKSARVMPLSTGRGSMVDFFKPTSISGKPLISGMGEIIGKSVGRIGAAQLSISPGVLFNFPTLAAPTTTIPKTKFISGMNLFIATKERQIQKTATPPKNKDINIPSSGESYFQTPKEIQVPIQIQIPKQVQIPKQIPKQVQVQRQVSVPKQLNISLFQIPPASFRTPKSSGLSLGIRKPITDSFQVEVRRSGKFFPIGIPLVKGEALSLGRRAVKSTAAATFKLTPSTKKSRTLGLPKITELSLFPEFRKKQPDMFIQRRRYRITTRGEKREIPGKALRLRKSRRIRW